MEKHKTNTNARQQQEEQQRRVQEHIQQQEEQKQRMILEHLHQESNSADPHDIVSEGIPIQDTNINGNNDHNEQQPRYGSFCVENTAEGVPSEGADQGGGPKVPSQHSNSHSSHIISHRTDPLTYCINHIILHFNFFPLSTLNIPYHCHSLTVSVFLSSCVPVFLSSCLFLIDPKHCHSLTVSVFLSPCLLVSLCPCLLVFPHDPTGRDPSGLRHSSLRGAVRTSQSTCRALAKHLALSSTSRYGLKRSS